MAAVVAVMTALLTFRHPRAEALGGDIAPANAALRRLEIVTPPAPADLAQARGALEDFTTGRPFALVENGQPKLFEVSLDEVYLPEAPVPDRWRQVQAQGSVSALLATAEGMASKTGTWPGLVIYPQGRKESQAARRILTAQWLVQVHEREKALAAVEAAGFGVIEEPDYAPGYVIVAARAGGARGGMEAAAALAGHPAIAGAAPMLLHQLEKKMLPNDVLFAEQWHLQNTGQTGGKVGTDIAVTSVWDTYQGEGIRIGIVDDGLNLSHPDLRPNLDTSNDYDWNDSPPDDDPSADPYNKYTDGDRHGTAVAGLAGARGGNGIGIAGVAPKAQLVGFRLIAAPTSDGEDAQAVTRGNDIIQVKSNSWGWSDFRDGDLGFVGPLMTAARESAARLGRGGLGTILLWASGNGRPYDQGNKDGCANSIYSIAVGGVGNTGALAPYSEGGSHLTVVGPTSGGTRQIHTTDDVGTHGYNDGVKKGELADASYTKTFGGTSAATPVVAGVTALMLQANPLLGWRDVKEILLRSSTKLFPAEPGWVSRTGGASTGLPFIKHHEKYGGGLVNAKAAVAMAQTWNNLGPMIQHYRSLSPEVEIPDNDARGVVVVFDFSDVASMRVEQVTVKVNVSHPVRGDLRINLRSPSGSVSMLAAETLYDYGPDYQNWTFSSVRHWGEAARGKWILTCQDLTKDDGGTFRSAAVTLFGAEAAPVAIVTEPQPLLVGEGDRAAFWVESAGYGVPTHQWKKNNVAMGTTIAAHAIERTKLTDAGSYHVIVRNLTGTATSAPVPLGVLNRVVPSQTINEGATCTFKASGAGPGMTFRWLRDGQPVTNGGRISGAESATLVVKAVALADSGNYVCRATLSGTQPALALDTGPATLTVRLKPVVNAPFLTNGVVSGSVRYQFTADNSATRFSATGLPPGLVFDTTTGVLSGTPNAAGTYKIKATAANGAGVSLPVEVTWSVDKLPATAQGTFSGIIDRSGLTGDLGGRFTCVVSNTGMLSGSLVLAGKSHSLTGRLQITAVDANPSAVVMIKRPAPQPMLRVEWVIDLLTGHLTGSVAEVAGAPAALEGWRNPWAVTRNATMQAGSYNAALLLPGEFAGNAVVPQGTGFAQLAVTVAGVATWSGKAADASAIVGSTTLGPADEVPLQAMLYANTGSLQGWCRLSEAELDGVVDLLKRPQPVTPANRSYRDGIPLHAMTVTGAKYLPPAAGHSILGLQPGAGNVRLVFVAGGLAENLEQRFEITEANAAKMPAGSELNPHAVTLSLNPSTGSFSGSFTAKNNDPRDVTPPIAVLSRMAPFSGLLITRPEFQRAVGHFNLAELPDTAAETVGNTPLWSGDVTLEPALNR